MKFCPAQPTRAVLPSRSCMSKLTGKPIPKSWLTWKQDFCASSPMCARRLRTTLR